MAARAEVPAITTVTAAAVAVVMAAEVVVEVVVVVAEAATEVEAEAKTAIVGRVATIPTCRANRVRSSAKG